MDRSVMTSSCTRSCCVASMTSKTAVVAMHPIGSPGYLPMFSGLARAGLHVIASDTRYSNGDAALLMENVLLDLGAVVRDAKERLGYQRVLLAGWSGGGSLMMGYQGEAEDAADHHDRGRRGHPARRRGSYPC